MKSIRLHEQRNWRGITPPDPNVNYFMEPWDVVNSNWVYDGDEDLTTYPGYLAVQSPATSTFEEFTPLAASFYPWPRVPTVPMPLTIKSVYRVLTDALEIRVPVHISWSVDDGVVADNVSVLFYYEAGDARFNIEVLGQKSGVPFDQVYNSGITFVADQEVTIESVVLTNGFKVYVNGALVVDESGWVFPTIGYTSQAVGRSSATHQGLVKTTEIYTVAP